MDKCPNGRPIFVACIRFAGEESTIWIVIPSGDARAGGGKAAPVGHLGHAALGVVLVAGGVGAGAARELEVAEGVIIVGDPGVVGEFGGDDAAGGVQEVGGDLGGLAGAGDESCKCGSRVDLCCQ